MTARETIRAYLKTHGWRKFEDIHQAAFGYEHHTVVHILREPWVENVYDCGDRFYRIRKESVMLPVEDSKVFIVGGVVWVVCNSLSGSDCKHVYRGEDGGCLTYVSNTLEALPVSVPEPVRLYAFGLEEKQ